MFYLQLSSSAFEFRESQMRSSGLMQKTPPLSHDSHAADFDMFDRDESRRQLEVML